MEFENMYTQQDSLMDDKYGFSGSSNGWITSRINWQFILAKGQNKPTENFKTQLRFRFVSDTVETNQDGWMIDNILIQTRPSSGAVSEINKSKTKVHIAPNPSNNYIQLNLEDQELKTYSATIYNTIGQKVKEIKEISSAKNMIDISELKLGIYYIQLQNHHTILGSTKFIKL